MQTFKNLITSAVAGVCLLVGIDSFATGATPINSPQSGLLNFTNGGSQSITNQFAVPYTYPPAMSLFLIGGYTNSLPFTNVVTATNFIVSTASSAGAATNATIAWTASPAACVTQWGATANVAATPTNVAFATPYAYPPVVVLTGGATNVTAVAAITAVTTTNFTFLCNAAITNQWVAFGEAYNPGTQTVTH